MPARFDPVRRVILKANGVEQKMDPINPIFAFGLTPPISFRRKLLLLLASLASVSVIAFILIGKTTVSVPERVVLIAAIRGGTPLPNGLPRTWMSVKEHKKFPSLVGLALQDKRLVPFAFHPGQQGLLTFESEIPISRPSRMPLAQILWLLGHTIVAHGYLQLDGSHFDERLAFHLAGPIDRSGTWRTDARLSPAPSQALPSHEVAINLDALPDAWPLIQSVTREEGFLLDESERPALFGWTSASSSIPIVELHFTTKPSATTTLAFASAAGLSESVRTKLPDDVVVEELHKPTFVLQATSPVLIALESGLQLSITDQTLATVSSEKISPVSPCDARGRPILHISGSALQSLFRTFQLPELLFRLFEAREVSGKIEFSIC